MCQQAPCPPGVSDDSPRTQADHTRKSAASGTAPAPRYETVSPLPTAAQATEHADALDGAAQSHNSMRYRFLDWAPNTADVAASGGMMAALECALDHMAAQRPPGVLAGQFAVLRDRARGGQSLVQMAKDPDGFRNYAIKFFSRRRDFERENALYQELSLRATLPPLHLSCSNDDKALKSSSGFSFPPFMVRRRFRCACDRQTCILYREHQHAGMLQHTGTRICKPCFLR